MLTQKWKTFLTSPVVAINTDECTVCMSAKSISDQCIILLHIVMGQMSLSGSLPLTSDGTEENTTELTGETASLQGDINT